jgi:hypothetical protein
VWYRSRQLYSWQSQTIRHPHFRPGPRAIAANNEPLGGLPRGEEPPVLSLADGHYEEKLDGLRKHYSRYTP